MDCAEDADLMKAGMVKNVSVSAIIIKLMESVEHVILTVLILVATVFVTMDFMVMLINAKDVTLAVVNVLDLVLHNASLARMLVMT